MHEITGETLHIRFSDLSGFGRIAIADLQCGNCKRTETLTGTAQITETAAEDQLLQKVRQHGWKVNEEGLLCPACAEAISTP